MGEQALVAAIVDFRKRGKTLVLITHRTSAIGVTNKLLVLQGGVAHMFGPTAQVLTDLTKAAQQQAQPAKPAAALVAVATKERAEAGAANDAATIDVTG